MDTNKVEILLRAIELGSLSKAAQEYMYTPSALSHILDTVESEIGIKIINRTYKGIEVAKNSEDIVNELKQLVNTQKRIIKMANEQKKGRQTINIATYSSISKTILPQIVKGFKREYPYIDLNIIVTDNLINCYNSNDADILFGEKHEIADSVWEELITDPYMAVFPASYDGKGRKIKREELYGSPFIMTADGATNKYMEKDKMKDVLYVDSPDDGSVLQMVKAGMGASIQPSLSVAGEKDVVCCELDPEIGRVLGVMYRKNDFKNKAYIKNFIKHINRFSGDMLKVFSK